MAAALGAALVLALAGAVALAVARLVRWAAIDRALASIPMPPGHWLLGHLPTLNRPDHHLIMRAWAEQLGGLYRMRLGPIQVRRSLRPWQGPHNVGG